MPPDALAAKRTALAKALRDLGRVPDERFIEDMPERVLDEVLEYYTGAIHVG
jgi:hypothetical protein